MNEINLHSEHIARYEARMKHLDDLLDRARVTEAGTEEDETELKEITGKRVELETHVNELRLKDLANWKQEEIEMSGPMGIWDAAAQQLEALVEKLESR